MPGQPTVTLATWRRLVVLHAPRVWVLHGHRSRQRNATAEPPPGSAAGGNRAHRSSNSLIWLVVGLLAAGQRGYLGGSGSTCAKAGNTVLTIVAGPLNYIGINPKVKCDVPQPSK